jgi:hypothetical protein
VLRAGATFGGKNPRATKSRIPARPLAMNPRFFHSLFGLAMVGAVSFSIAPASAAEPVTARHEGKQIIFATGDRELMRYQAEAGELPRADIKEVFHRGGYLHPIYTPSGVLVTDDYPSNHVHHHGIWTAWTKTEFEGRAPDFWNMGDGKGRVEFVAVDDVWSKDGRAGFKARHRFVDLLVKPPKAVLDETWDVVVSSSEAGSNAPPRTIIDLTMTQTCSTDSPLKLPKYHYGGFGFRGHGDWNGKDAWRILTSEGETDRIKANETRGRWCWNGGLVGGKLAGVTILCAPENFRAPQPMRVNPDQPFFCYAPPQLGEMEIAPGKPYVARYRVIAADGQPTREQADAWWKEWTEPR